MNKLNKIFYGPAGTGKTRSAIEEAVKIIKNNNDLKKFDTSTYKGVIDCLKAVSNLPKLDIKDDNLLKDINNLSIKYEAIIQKRYMGYSESGLINMKNDILEYRVYPLIETVTFHPSYSYQDFVEGISVETTSSNGIAYKVKDGIF